MEAELVETWQINHRINLYLLDAIAPEALPSVPLAKGGSVAEQLRMASVATKFMGTLFTPRENDLVYRAVNSSSGNSANSLSGSPS
jgi:hypothetical protein